MIRRTICLLTVLLVMFSTVIGYSAQTPEELYNSAVIQLDKFEQSYPREQAELFKLRAIVNQLYSRANNRTSTDPVDANGNLLTADLSVGSTIYDFCDGLTNDDLKYELSRIVGKHSPVNYQQAQDLVFGKLHNFGGKVECVYTGRVLETPGEPNANDMNVEHTWPQSQGATGIAKSDLHHLFPTDSRTNGRRGHLPFGNVPNPTWSNGGSCTDKKVFEVRAKQRGDTARAKFYFAIRYNKKIGSKEEAVLKQWHDEDPVSESERVRNDKVENCQHNRNPFIDHPEYVGQINDF